MSQLAFNTYWNLLELQTQGLRRKKKWGKKQKNKSKESQLKLPEIKYNKKKEINAV